MRRIMRCNVLDSGLDETELDLACYGLFEIAQIIAGAFALPKFKPAEDAQGNVPTVARDSSRSRALV